MLSYRDQLAKIGVQPGVRVSYREFSSRPQRLSEALRSMDAPSTQDWSQLSDINRDDYWTDEVQGVAWDGAHWIFSTNANQSKPGAEAKAIYVFNGGQSLADGNWKSRVKYNAVSEILLRNPLELLQSQSHWGQLTYYNGFVYVSHFWSDGPLNGRSNVVVFKDNDGFLVYDNWIELKQVTSSNGKSGYPEFQAINPWDGNFYTCLGGVVDELFVHNPETGEWLPDPDSKEGKGKILKLDPSPKGVYITIGEPPQVVSRVQGACFSDNGHLYIACDVYVSSKHKAIFCYSALNGHQFGYIPVLAEELGQELEGVCYGHVSWPDGRTAQIHAVLLDNRDAALDDIFFKSFSSAKPDIV